MTHTESVQLFKCLADKSRLAILTNLLKEPMYVELLARRLGIMDAGEGDFPAGEVYIAPIEELSYGTIYFNNLWLDTDDMISDVILTIDKGKIVDANNVKVLDVINNLPPNGNVIAEFGLGMNPNIDELTGYTALDEKKKGTFHIAIGMNTLFGGLNECMVHIDFVGYGKIVYL